MLVSCHGVSKRYGPTVALANVAFEVRAGEVVGLAGENGAGKSTLLKIIGGAESADTGTIRINSNVVAMSSVRDANLLGVFTMYQDPQVVSTLPLYENVFLGFHDRFARSGFVNRARMMRQAAPHLERVRRGLGDVPNRTTSLLDFPGRQLLQLARAFACVELLEISKPVLLLDEPTAALHEADVRRLFEVVEVVRDRFGIVLVSHRTSELFESTDRLCVMRDGSVVAETPTSNATEDYLHRVMVGRQREEEYYREEQQIGPRERIVLSVKDLSFADRLEDLSFSLREGEMLGIAGVEGSSKDIVGRCLFGALNPSGGTVELVGKKVNPESPAQMARRGVGFLPTDRSTDSLVADLSVKENMTLAALRDFTRRVLPLLNLNRERSVARKMVSTLRIKTASERSPVRSLSGGNQQKVALAKWMLLQLNVLIVENPTQGLDVGARYEVYGVMRDLAAGGCAILLVSDDLVELIGLSDRILIMKDGRLTGERLCPPGNKPSEDELIALMV